MVHRIDWHWTCLRRLIWFKKALQIVGKFEPFGFYCAYFWGLSGFCRQCSRLTLLWRIPLQYFKKKLNSSCKATVILIMSWKRRCSPNGLWFWIPPVRPFLFLYVRLSFLNALSRHLFLVSISFATFARGRLTSGGRLGLHWQVVYCDA